MELFNELVEKLEEKTFEECVKEMNTEYNVECKDDDVYEDDDWYDFIKSFDDVDNIYPIKAHKMFAISTTDNEIYLVDYEEIMNRFNEDLGCETVIMFDTIREITISEFSDMMSEETEDIWHYGKLLEYAKQCIDDDCLVTAIDILDTINESGEYVLWYIYNTYSYSSPEPIETIEDLEGYL